MGGGGAFFVNNLFIFLSIKVFSCVFVPIFYSDEIKGFQTLGFDVTGRFLSAACLNVCADVEIKTSIHANKAY